MNLQNKVGQFAANPIIRNMVGQPVSTFDIRKVMDDRKIFIVNLSKGRMGEGNANLVGSMLITKIYLAAMSRADVGADAVKELPPFYLYVDEFQSFANESFADILSEARKYKLSLTIAHQYIEQMSDEVRAAVFGNVGSMIAFRVGAFDSEVLEKEFAPVFTAEDMVNLGFAQIYLKLMINGVGSHPFSATTLNRPKVPPRTYVAEVVAASRKQFARPRAQVEEDITKWHEPVPEPPRDPNAPPIPETRKYPPGMRPERPRMNTGYAQQGQGSMQFGARSPRTYSDAQFGGPRPTLPEQAPLNSFRAQTVTPSERPLVPKEPNESATQYQIEGSTQEFPDQRASVPLRRPPALHQPFKKDLPGVIRASSAVFPKKAPLTPVQIPGVGAPLVMLKSQPKKDKGPSEGNLSSLRDVLSKTMQNTEKNPLVGVEQPMPKIPGAPSAPEREPLLQDTDQQRRPKEVPKEVLMSVLSEG
jgi:hypothetical protein